MSKLINQSRLGHFATQLWEKIRRRYDVAFKEAALEEKKLKFTPIAGAKKEVDLAPFARLQDQNNFKQDVAVDNGQTYDTSFLGTINADTSNERTVGNRSLTSNLFVDNYISKLRIYMKNDSVVGTNVAIKLFAITKHETDKAQDTVKKLMNNGNEYSTQIKAEGSIKYVDIDINESFDTNVYFLARCNGGFGIVHPVDTKYQNDVVQLNNAEPPSTIGGRINWDVNVPAQGSILKLYGRESISSLSDKIKKVESDGSQYVLKTDVTLEGGETRYADKVVKLDNNGKLHTSVLPAIATNEFITIEGAWAENSITSEYQNGDIIYHRPSGKRYLCVDKQAAFDNGRFVELNSKDGTVTGINDRRGAVTLDLLHEADKIKLSITGDGGDVVNKEIPVITTQEVEAIVNNLPTT